MISLKEDFKYNIPSIELIGRGSEEFVLEEDLLAHEIGVLLQPALVLLAGVALAGALEQHIVAHVLGELSDIIIIV